MKKIMILISILVSMTGGIAFYSQSKQEEMAKLEQVNVSDENTEGKVAGKVESKENEIVENEEILEQGEVKEEKNEIKSDLKTESKNVSSASNSKTETENKGNNSTVNEIPKVEQKTESPKENNTTPSSNSTTQPPKTNVTTKLYESITGGKKEFSSESEAFARGTEIQNKELDYVLDYNEQHPEAPIQPAINYFRVYPSVIDENGQYWYYLHFFCASGEGNDAKLKSIY